MNRTSARRVLPSDAQCVPRWVDSPDFERHGPYVVCATRRPPVTWALVSALVSSRQMPSVCLDGSTVWTLDAVLPWTVPMRAVSSRQMPSVCLDGLTVRILSAMDRTSAHRLRRLRHPPPTGHLGACVCACVLPSDAQCVPRWVDSPDFGGPVSNSGPGAIDVADDIRLDCRLVHIYSINESIRLCLDGSTVLTRTLGAIDVLGNTRLDCCLVHIYSINESIRLYLDGPTVRTLDAVLPWTVPLRAVSSRQMPSVCLDGLTVRILSVMDRTSAHRLRRLRHPPPTSHLGACAALVSALVSSRQMPSVCLDGSTVWTLDAVLPWTVPIRAVSSRQMPTPWTVPLRIGYVVCATRRPPATWALVSALVSSRQMPSVCLDGSTVWTLDAVLPWTVPMRAVSSRQMPSVCLDGLTVRILSAMDRTSAHRLRRLRHPPPTSHLGACAALVSALVSSRQMPSVCLDGSTVWTLDAVLPWTVPIRAVSSRQMPSVCLDGLTVRTLSAMDRTSAHRLRRLRHPPPTSHLGACVCACVLPSDAQCVPRWVDSLDVGCRVAMDRTYARRVLPSDAQCVPRWVDSPDFGGPVSNSDPGAIDVADDTRLDCRLVHIYSINESIRLCLDGSTVLTRTLGAIDVLDNTRLDCCLVHIYSINESIRLYPDGPTVRTLDAVLPWIVPLRVVFSRQMPSVCLDGLTVRTLSAVLPWTVPLRLGYVGCATRRPPVTWVLVSSRQMPSVCLDGSTVRILDAVLPWTVDSPDFKRRVAIDRTSAPRLRRLHHPPATNRGTASGVQQQYLTHIYVRHESSDAEGHLADLATTLNGVFNGYAPTYNKSPESTMGSLKKEDEADPSASIKSFRTGPFLTLQSLSARVFLLYTLQMSARLPSAPLPLATPTLSNHYPTGRP
ncbi:hypothetical protein B0H14DRAFT_3524833 [Mycena olivaceomarginata]|nr:hypothetical protein B0H14DRAFT_3524833 [Mycena olivaceomarginata]